MGSVNQLDLSLSSTTITTTLKPSYVPKTITNLLNDLADIDDVSKKMTVLNDYLCQHMEELSSVEFFKRKLPQCMLLLLDAIEVIKDEILKLEKGKESATESSTSAAERYFSEFLLRKRSEHTKMTEETKYQASSSANLHQAYDEEDEGKEMEMMEKEDQEGKGKEIMEKDDDDENDDDDDDDDDESGGLGGGSAGRRGDEQREYPRVVIRSKRPDGDNKNKKLMKKNIIPKINENYPVPNEPLIEQVLFPEPDDPCWRNMSRRYWTPHLHATFLDALDVLGGPEVATPKQIRELMHIEDLTNDQVKSHLQKHRLHNRGLLHQHAANCNDHMAGPHYNWEPGTYNRGHWIPGASQLNYRPRQPPARRNAGAYNDGGNGMEIDEIRISDGSGWFPNFKRSMGPDA